MSYVLTKPGFHFRTIPVGLPAAASNPMHLGPNDAPASTSTGDQCSHGLVSAVLRSTPADFSLKSKYEALWRLLDLLMNLTSIVTNTLPDSGLMNWLPDFASYLKLVTSTIHPLESAQGFVQEAGCGAGVVLVGVVVVGDVVVVGVVVVVVVVGVVVVGEVVVVGVVVVVGALSVAFSMLVVFLDELVSSPTITPRTTSATNATPTHEIT